MERRSTVGDGRLIECRPRLCFLIGPTRPIERGSGEGSVLRPDLISLKDRFRMVKIGLVLFKPTLGFSEIEPFRDRQRFDRDPGQFLRRAGPP